MVTEPSLVPPPCLKVSHSTIRVARILAVRAPAEGLAYARRTMTIFPQPSLDAYGALVKCLHACGELRYQGYYLYLPQREIVPVSFLPL